MTNQTSQTSQTAVNFYILPDSDGQNRLFFVFRLLEKALLQGFSTLIIAADKEQLEALDRLIWAAKPSRFIAHDIVRKGESTSEVVLLTDDASLIQTLQPAPQIVIDLSYDAVPITCDKVMLVANQHPDILPNARMKYQAYADQGVKPAVHKISEQWLSFRE